MPNEDRVQVHFVPEGHVVAHYGDPSGDHVVVHCGDLSGDRQERHTFVLIPRQSLCVGHHGGRVVVHCEDPDEDRQEHHTFVLILRQLLLVGHYGGHGADLRLDHVGHGAGLLQSEDRARGERFLFGDQWPPFGVP